MRRSCAAQPSAMGGACARLVAAVQAYPGIAACRCSFARHASAGRAGLAVSRISGGRLLGHSYYYHRYTVDEHSFVAVENVHALRTPDNELERRFRDILDGIERPDLLFLSLLLHDVGK